MRKQLGTQESQVTKITRRVRSLEKANEALTKTANLYEHERRGLEREVSDADECQKVSAHPFNLHLVKKAFEIF